MKAVPGDRSGKRRMTTKRKVQSRKSAPTGKQPARKAKTSKPTRATAAAVVRKPVRAPARSDKRSKAAVKPVAKKKPDIKVLVQPQPKTVSLVVEENRIAVAVPAKATAAIKEAAEIKAKPKAESKTEQKVEALAKPAVRRGRRRTSLRDR